jgi:hypothetical protein
LSGQTLVASVFGMAGCANLHHKPVFDRSSLHRCP